MATVIPRLTIDSTHFNDKYKLLICYIELLFIFRSPYIDKFDSNKARKLKVNIRNIRDSRRTLCFRLSFLRDFVFINLYASLTIIIIRITTAAMINKIRIAQKGHRI
jgi:hypothetical protein